MKRSDYLTRLEREKLVAIVRLKDEASVASTMEALVEGGFQALEITSNTPGFEQALAKARNRYPDLLIGAGTITDPDLAQTAITAGAQFLVTPNTDPEVVRIAHKADIPVLMGALTPTEVCQAVAAGADIVKLFPAGAMGIPYFKAIKGPLSEVKFFVVGGIGLDNLSDWLEAGAAGAGIGSILTQGDASTIKQTAKAFITQIKQN